MNKGKMIFLRRGSFVSLILCAVLVGYGAATERNEKTMIVRVSEIEVHPDELDRYKAILNEEAAASVALEPGVVSIFPMIEREHPNRIRILEIYASREAYESHLKTPHFQKYKTTTLKMVESLRLVDMDSMDPEAMPAIFRKMNAPHPGRS